MTRLAEAISPPLVRGQRRRDFRYVAESFGPLECKLAIFNAYFDESGKKGDHPVVSFSGVCVPGSKLQEFDDEWRSLLRLYEIRSLHMARVSRLSEKHGPKMPRGQSPTDRIQALKPFADCINEYLEVGMMQAWDVRGFNALSERVRRGLGSPDDPYYLAFSRGLMELADYIHSDDHISLICDDDRETALDCYRHYRGMSHAREDVRAKFVSLSFAKDDYFPALQAADMVAFLCRLQARWEFYGDRYDFRALFTYLTTEKGLGYMKWFIMTANEEQIRALSESLEHPRKTLAVRK